MALPDGIVRVTAFIEADTAAKVKKYAKALGWSESRFVRALVWIAMDDNEWLYKAMCGGYGKVVKIALDAMRAKAGERGEEPADGLPGMGVDKEVIPRTKRQKGAK